MCPPWLHRPSDDQEAGPQSGGQTGEYGDWRSGWRARRYGPHGWPPGLAGKRRFLFWRFAAIFGGLAFLFLAVITVVLIIVFSQAGLGPLRSGALVGLACGVPFIFFALAALIAGWTFRRLGSPLADVMAAADAVAGGDLSVRVSEGAVGELGRLARSFNRMAAELARAEQQRRNLTADVAHELRTPLHIIQGNLEGILDGVYEATPDHIAATLEETRLLARLVSDLQTLSLAEAGQLPLHPLRFSAADLISDVSTSFSGQAAEAGVTLEAQANGEPESLEIFADLDRLDQVLSNLTANALRYTPPGGRVVLRAEPSPDGVQLKVEDTGAGIPTEDLPYVFDRFWRGDRSRARGERSGLGLGAGLGLAIARSLVHAHGGRISVASQVGQGTKFTIELPEASPGIGEGS